MPITDTGGRLLGPFAIMLLSPEVGNAMQQVGAKIRFGTTLTGRERELAILTVGGRAELRIRAAAHVPAARGLGLTEPQIDTVLAGRTEDGLSADEAMVARLALAMTVDRTLSDEDYADGVGALGQERLAELTWLVGYYRRSRCRSPFSARCCPSRSPPGTSRLAAGAPAPSAA